MRLTDKILEECREWDTDKWVHIVLIMPMAWMVSTCCHVAFHSPRPLDGLAGIAAAIVAALVKEIYDKRTTGLFDAEDLAADFIGIALFYVIYAV